MSTLLEPKRRALALAVLFVGLPAAGCAPERNAPADPMRVVELVRDLLADPPAWRVARSHELLAPNVDVVCPSWHFRRDGADMPALVMAPPCEVDFTIEADGPARLKGKAGVDLATVRFLSEELEQASFEFECLLDGERVWSGISTIERRADPPGSEWITLGGEEGIAVEPGVVVTLRTRAMGPDGQPTEPPVAVRAGFGGLRLERRRFAERTRSSPASPNLVLVVMDTLRVDRLSTYGYEKDTSPHLDALAARGTLFENAYASSSWTWPSTASLLTGLHPREHGVVLTVSCFLVQGIQTLAETLQSAGFSTAAWSGNPLVTASRNFDQGFELFDDSREAFRKTGAFFDDVTRWIEERAGTRFFLYLHLVEPHHPYDALPGGLRRFAPDVPATVSERVLELVEALRKTRRGNESGALELSASDEERRWIDEIYDACVWSGDHWLGELTSLLERLELAGETVIVFTSDHGEELYDHDFLGHGHDVFEELVRAPLVMAGPGIPRGRRIDQPVSNRHVGPFLASLAGEALGGLGGEGATLLAPVEEPVYFSTEKGWWEGRGKGALFGMRAGELSLHYALAEGNTGSGGSRLYDLSDDPAQLTDVSRERPDDAARLRDQLDRHLEALRSAPAAAEFRGGAEALRLMERIGYAGGDEGSH